MNKPKVSANELFSDKDQATLTVGALGIVVWRGECTLRGVTRVKEMGLALLANSPAAVIIGVVEETSTIPGPEARQMSVDVNDQLNERGVVAYGAIFPEIGFSGAWKRGVITSLNMLSRRRYPMKVFQQPSDACQWFAEMPELAAQDWKLTGACVDRFRQNYAERFGRPTALRTA